DREAALYGRDTGRRGDRGEREVAAVRIDVAVHASVRGQRFAQDAHGRDGDVLRPIEAACRVQERHEQARALLAAANARFRAAAPRELVHQRTARSSEGGAYDGREGPRIVGPGKAVQAVPVRALGGLLVRG